jgi:hypothetical protein
MVQPYCSGGSSQMLGHFVGFEIPSARFKTYQKKNLNG